MGCETRHARASTFTPHPSPHLHRSTAKTLARCKQGKSRDARILPVRIPATLELPLLLNTLFIALGILTLSNIPPANLLVLGHASLRTNQTPLERLQQTTHQHDNKHAPSPLYPFLWCVIHQIRLINLQQKSTRQGEKKHNAQYKHPGA